MTVDDSQRTEFLKQQSRRNVDQLRNECKTLASNNDRLVNVIAQNNASKQTIDDLKKRLEYAQKNQEDKIVNFDKVNENLDEELTKAQNDAKKQALIKEAKLKESQELQAQKTTLKLEQKKLEDELKKLEQVLNQKTGESTRVASKKIILEEEISDLQGKIQFEREHFKLMEEALKLEVDEHNSRASSPMDYQDFIDNLLKEYAKQFGEEYEKLMRKAQIREKALLITKLEKLKEINAAKEVELNELKEKLKQLGQEIVDNEKRRDELKKELAILEAQKHKEHEEYIKQKQIKEARAHQLEKDNDALKDRIETTQKSANEALKVIIELEFEIKTYEKLLKMEENRGNLSVSQVMDDTVNDSHVDIPLSEIKHQQRSRSSSKSSVSTDSSSRSSQRQVSERQYKQSTPINGLDD